MANRSCHSFPTMIVLPGFGRIRQSRNAEVAKKRSRDWVLWAPDTGHFRASEGGVGLIGWQVNRGWAANPDFYDAEQLRYVLEDSRHEILQRVLKEARPAREIVADLVARGEMEKPPTLAEFLHGVPEITLEGFEDRETAPTDLVTLTATAHPTAPDVGLTRMEFFINGSRIHENDLPYPLQKLPDGRIRQKFPADLLQGTNEVRAVAFNERGVASFPATLRIKYAGTQATSRLWVLGVGLEDYQNIGYRLPWCVDDVKEMNAALRERGRGIFASHHYFLLPNEDATRPKIEAQFAELATQVKKQDVFVFLFAGHGALNEEGEYHLVPYDVVKLTDEEGERQLREKGLSKTRLEILAARIPAHKKVMLLDSCHSGAMARGPAEEVAIKHLSLSTGMAILASSGADQLARADEEKGHGYFTLAFLEGLRDGKAANAFGYVTVNSLKDYIWARLPQLTNDRQYPKSFGEGNFPLGIVRPGE